MSTDQTIVFADLEATTADPLTAKTWEIALIVRSPHRFVHPDGPDTVEMKDDEHEWLVDPGPLDGADRQSLRVTGFYERTGHLKPHLHDGVYESKPFERWANPHRAARDIAKLTDRAILVANNPTYDGPVLDRFLREYGQIGTWDYRHRDLGSMFDGWMAGWRICHEAAAEVITETGARTDLDSWLGWKPEWAQPGIKNIACALGIDPDDYEAHAALEDARLLRDCWDAMFRLGFRA